MKYLDLTLFSFIRNVWKTLSITFPIVIFHRQPCHHQHTEPIRIKYNTLPIRYQTNYIIPSLHLIRPSVYRISKLPCEKLLTSPSASRIQLSNHLHNPNQFREIEKNFQLINTKDTFTFSMKSEKIFLLNFPFSFSERFQ